jgi:hypothetical protein
MIGVILLGRLGNQLFQYAFAYSAARKLNTSFFFDSTWEPFLLESFFDVPEVSTKIGWQYGDSFENSQFRLWFKKIRNKLLVKEEVFIDNTEQPGVVMNQLKNKTIYRGWYQSEDYFKAYKTEILGKLTIKEPIRKLFEQTYGELYSKKRIVAVHVRRTDFQFYAVAHLDKDLRLPMHYYEQLIEKENKPNTTFVFLSDEPDFIEYHFSSLTNKYVSRADQITDLQHLMCADVCIIANSTFSWWGAYLNRKVDKIVYAPKFFLGFKNNFEYPKGAIPKDWHQVKI